MSLEVAAGHFATNAATPRNADRPAPATSDFAIFTVFAALVVLMLIGISLLLPVSDNLSALPLV